MPTQNRDLIKDFPIEIYAKKARLVAWDAVLVTVKSLCRQALVGSIDVAVKFPDTPFISRVMGANSLTSEESRDSHL